MSRAARGIPHVLRELLSEAVDYAGLFPPAELGMTEAARNYAEYQTGEHSWMLGRFILPATRLDEFDDAAASFLPRGSGSRPWRLSVLLGTMGRSEIERALKFNCSHWTESPIGHAVIEVTELKAAAPTELEEVRALVPKFFQTYFEIPLDRDPDPFMEVASRAQAGVKARTGGVTTDAFPDVEDLARFMESAVRARAPFKVTAGLHHVVAGDYPLTYAPTSACTSMFGFLNVFVAAVLLDAGVSREDAVAVLNERSLSAFEFHDRCLHWHDRKAELDTVSDTRTLLRAFGSCSFSEPVEELRAAGLLA
jgi:hypothetical protein